MSGLRQLMVGLLIVTGLMGCGGEMSPDSSAGTGSPEVLNVVATVGMVADVVRQVGGDRVRVTQLMGAGVDPHLYKATRDDARKILLADLIVCSGLMLEGRMEEVLTDVSQKRPVVTFTSPYPRDQLLTPDGADGHPDPHLWMDASAWAMCVSSVTDALCAAIPDQADAFRERSQSCIAELSALHEYGKARIASIPEGQRVLVTSHDAFGYFGRAYGLEVLGVQGLSTESEAGLQRINELVDVLVERKIAAVFVESSVSPRNIQAVIDGAKSRGHEVVIGGELFSDAMGDDGTWEGTYVGMLDHNITVVTRALGGSAPERGMSERLTP
jgi:manganese/zinc/iron transport system substrate-binding protein